MINIIKLSKYYGTDTIFDNISLRINDNEKIGLVGPNGCGKTTLIKMIIGDEEPSKGNIIIEKKIRIGYVPQHIEFDQNLTLIDVMLSQYNNLSEKLSNLESKMSSSSEDELKGILADYQIIRDEYDEIEGDSIPARAKKILDSLGLEDRDDQMVETLSGGGEKCSGSGQSSFTPPRPPYT